MVTTTERIQLNRKTAAQWTAANPVLLPGEAGVELDTGRVKFGNATGAAWTALPYSYAGAAGVTTVNSRTGDVTLTGADVGLGNVQNTSDVNKPVSTAQATALAAKADYPAGGVDGQALVKSGTSTAWTTFPTGSGGSGGANSSLDRVRYVSKAGSDSNTGLGWDAAKLTVGAAITALNGPGTIYIGGGTYTEAGLNPNGATLIGTGWRGTTLSLATTGTLITTTASTNDGSIRDLTLTFASTSVTGTLLDLNGSFKMQFHGVRFLGSTSSAAGQVGVWIRANAGDHHFVTCKWESLAVGIQNDSTISYLIGGIVSSCGTGVRGGDPTGGSTYNSGIVLDSVTFLGTSNYYINVTGKADTWMVTKCWFDGHATTAAIEIGAPGTGFGPRLFVLRDIPYTSAATGINNVRVHAAAAMIIDGVRFGSGSGNGTDLAFPIPANAPKGQLGICSSAQGTNLNAVVPTTWSTF